MKKNPILACLGLNLLAADPTWAQSTFWLNNRVGAAVDAPLFDARGVPLSGPDYLTELWGGATSNSLAPATTYLSRQRIIVPFLTGSDAGYFRDSYLGRPGTDDLSVFAVPPSGWAWLQVRTWDARLGTTYEEVLARGLGGYGESPLFYAQGSDPTLILPAPPAPLIGLQSFSLREVVPEPSTWALLAMGGTVLALRAARRDSVDREALNGNLQLKRSNSAAGDDWFRAFTFPVVAVNPDPAKGDDLYVAYPDKAQNPDSNDRADVFFVRSTDGGATWTSPLRASTVPNNDQWMPVMCVKPDGTKLFMGWYDRRGDTNNSLIDVYGDGERLPVTAM